MPDARAMTTSTRRRRAPCSSSSLLLVAGAVAPDGCTRAAAPVDGPAWALLPLGLLVVAASLLVVRFRAGAHEDSVTLVEAVLAVLLFAYAGAAGRARHGGRGDRHRGAPAHAVRQERLQHRAVGLRGQPRLGRHDGRRRRRRAVAARAGRRSASACSPSGRRTTWRSRRSWSSRPDGGVPDVLRGLGPVIVGRLARRLRGQRRARPAVRARLRRPPRSPCCCSPCRCCCCTPPTGATPSPASTASTSPRCTGPRRRCPTPVDPVEAVPAVPAPRCCSGFDAGTAVLVVRTPARTSSCTRATADGAATSTASAPAPLWSALLEHGAPVRCDAGRGELGRLLADAGPPRRGVAHRSSSTASRPAAWSSSTAPASPGCRAASSTCSPPSPARRARSLEKGRLLARMLADRRRLGEIVGTTSDGILTVALDGTVTSWNPAMERITGAYAAEVVGRPGALAGLRARTVGGVARRPVDLGAGTARRPRSCG